MADAAVEFLLDNLQQLLNHHIQLIRGVEDQVGKLEKDLRRFKAFLSDCTKKRRREARVRELIKSIRDVVYEAEDIIDAFVTQAAEAKSKNYFAKAFSRPVTLHHIAGDVMKVASKIQDIQGNKNQIDFANLPIGDDDPDENEAPTIVRPENVVGFEDEAEKLIGYLKEETEQLDIISVIGMPGLGKTTLAWKIFHDPDIQYEFPTRIWVYVSSECTRKNVFLTILSEFTRVTEDMRNKSDQELAKIVYEHLRTGKFLIAMDDVWTTADWDRLEIAFPKDNKMGKILITSRHEEVARHANRIRSPHNLRFLTQDESWLLLRLKVFGKPVCPNDLEVFGKLIVRRCDGLPLAIVVIGGILIKKTTEDTGATRNAWRKVSESVSTYLNHEDPTRRMERIIELSYDKLPIHLRACFLYLGMFPEDFEIPVWKLTRMWIAEGFIQQKGSMSLEDIAESYLDEFINRNLVRVDKRKRDGKVKTCRIHDMLRDFCKNKAGDEIENFLQEMKRSDHGTFDPPIENIKKFRRLCVHYNVLNFVTLKPFGPHVRSFVCFSKEDINLPAEHISTIPAAFKLLRVLEVKPIKLSKIPSDVYHLVHLRYLAITLINLAVLPAAFAKLWNIQTLVVDTTSRTLEIKADIWNMVQLRHLKTNASASLPKPGKNNKSGKEGEKLQTLGTISPQSCTEDIFDRARFLKKLGIRGRLATLLESKSGSSFENLWKLDNLEKLKLMNDVFPSPPSEGKLRSLPPPYKFPPKLRSLTLSDTFLDWTHMSTLGLLQNLEVLKLKDKAFMGSSWEAADGGFRHLEVLYIGRTDLAIWVASAHHFPRLRCLELSNCEELQEVPFGLAEISSFQVLDLYRTKYAAKSARQICEAKNKKMQEEKNTNLNSFKLSIFPPDES